MRFEKKEFYIFALTVLSIFFSTRIWSHIELPFKETDIIGEYSSKNYNSLNDFLRYLIFISLPLFTFIFSKIFFYNLKFTSVLNSFKIEKKVPDNLKVINILALLFIVYLALEFLSIDFSIHKIDIYHEGQKLSSAYKSLLDGSLWSGSFITVGIIYETIGTKLIWKLFGHESIGSMRFLELIYILFTKVLLVFLLLEFTRSLSFNSFLKSIFFILTNFCAFFLIDYILHTGDTIHYREIPIILSLILIIKSLKKFSIINYSILGFLSFFTFLWSIDRGIVLITFLLIFIILLTINNRYKDIIYFLISILFFWTAFVIYDFKEFLFFFENTKTVLTEMNLLNGLIHPVPFSEEENSSRATKNLLVILFSLIYTVNIFLSEKKYFSYNLKFTLFFLSTISFLSYIYALSRSDGGHIKQAFAYPSIFLFLIIINFLLLYVSKIKYNFNFLDNKKNYILFLIIIVSILVNSNFKNIFTFQNRLNSYVLLDDKNFLNENEMNFINDAQKFFSDEKCIHLATTDSALYYLLRKPSCTRFYFTWSIGSSKNQKLLIDELKDTNFIILNGISDNWSLPLDIKYPLVNKFIIDNFNEKILFGERSILFR